MEESAEELVARARAGDADAFAHLVGDEWNRLHRMAWVVTGDFQRGQDAVQEALLRAFSSLWQLQDAGSFRAWLAQIVLHQARNMVRAEARHHRWPEVPWEEETVERLRALAPQDGPWDPQRAAEADWVRQRLQERIAALPPRQRDILVATAAGETVQAAAERLGITAGAARVALHRARASLRPALPVLGLTLTSGPPSRRWSRGGVCGMPREELGRRLLALGLELREGADVLEVGARVSLAGGECLVAHVVHDAGILAVIWRFAGPSGGRRRGAGFGRIRLGGQTVRPVFHRQWEDGWQCHQLRHPGSAAGHLPAVLAMDAWDRDRDLALDGAELELPLPPWDGGEAVPAVRVGEGEVAIRGFALGGLGGRADVELGWPEAASPGMTLDSAAPPSWAPRGQLPSLRGRPLARAQAQEREIRWLPLPNGAWPTDHADLRVDGPYDSQHGKGAPGARSGQWTFVGRLSGMPCRLVLPRIVVWQRIAPQILSLGAEHEGGPWEVPLGGGGAVLQLRLGAVRQQQIQFPHGQTLTLRQRRWQHRVLHPGPAPVLAGLFAHVPDARGRLGWWAGVSQPGLNGWYHHESQVARDGTITLACVALGTPTGPYDFPLSHGAGVQMDLPVDLPGTETLTAAAAGLLEPEGLVLAPDLTRLLTTVEALVRFRGGTRVELRHVLSMLLSHESGLGPEARAALGLKHAEPLLWRLGHLTGRPNETAARGPVQLWFEVGDALRQAAAEACRQERKEVTVGDLFVGILACPETEASVLLEDAGLKLEGARQVLFP